MANHMGWALGVSTTPTEELGGWSKVEKSCGLVTSGYGDTYVLVYTHVNFMHMQVGVLTTYYIDRAVQGRSQPSSSFAA